MANSWVFTACMGVFALLVVIGVVLALREPRARRVRQVEPPSVQPAVLRPYQSAFRAVEVRRTRLQNEAREVSETVNGWLECQAR
jgi:hypothetical protein